MNFMRQVLLLMVLVVSLLGCGQEHETPQQKQLAESLSEAEQQIKIARASFTNGSEADTPLPLYERKIIKQGELSFECAQLAETRAKIDSIIKAHESYIVKENESRYGARVEQRLIIRIPSERFESFVFEISQGVERFDRKQIEAVDVTEEFLDIEARLRIKKETESRYQALLQQANTVEDILAIEKQIEGLRADIESIEGRLKFLQNRVAYSTLTVTFYETVTTSATETFFSKFRTSVKDGWEFFTMLVLWLVMLWPFLLIVIALILVRFIFWRRNRNRSAI